MRKQWRIWILAAALGGMTLVPGMTSRAEEIHMEAACAPAGIMEVEDGSFLVTDTYHKVIWKIDGENTSLYAGTLGVKGLHEEPVGGYRDDNMSLSLFGKPWAIAPFKDGYAVSDPVNNAVRLISGNQVRTINIAMQLDNPTGLAADADGSLYIADTNHNAVIKVTSSGSVSSYINGLSEPTGLFYKNGSLYIADSGNNRILKTEAGMISATVGISAGGFMDGGLNQAAFVNPMGIAVDDDGTIYVSDTGNSAIRKIKDNLVTTLMVNQSSELQNVLGSPIGLLIKGDRLYVCDTFSKRLLIIPKG